MQAGSQWHALPPTRHSGAPLKSQALVMPLIAIIVYAGFVGMGFTLIEDMDYVVNQATATESIVVGLMRVISGTFLHAIFTTITALGIWKAVNATGGMRLIWAFLGWLGAVFLHGLFNYTVSFVENGFFLGTAISVVVTGSIVWLGVRSRKEEQRGLHRQLPVHPEHHRAMPAA